MHKNANLESASNIFKLQDIGDGRGHRMQSTEKTSTDGSDGWSTFAHNFDSGAQEIYPTLPGGMGLIMFD